MKVEGASVIVTGGARGLGKGFTEALLKNKAKVCFVDINEETGRETEAELKEKYDETSTFFMKCDISNEESFKAVFDKTIEKFGRVDILVNNAGILNEKDPTKTIQINLIGAMCGTGLAFEHMRKDKGGNGGLIVNISSIAGLSPAFFMPAYAAAKYGIVGYTRSIAQNPLNKTRYHVSFACLCPAFTDTQMVTGPLNSDDPPLIDFKENKPIVLAMINSFGVNTVDAVAEAFMNLVQNDDNNGAVVTIDTVQGTRYLYKDEPNKM